LDDIPAAGRGLIDQSSRFAAIKASGNLASATVAHLASISFADAVLGKVLDSLEGSQYLDNTTLVVWGDHGVHTGEKGHWEKLTLWGESTRVPLIISAPSLGVGGGRTDVPVSLLDLYPTLVDIHKLDAVPSLDGISLVPWLIDPDRPLDRGVVATWGRGNHAVCDRDFRYIRYEDESEELYDHRSDPNEWTNLASQSSSRELVDRLRSWLPVQEAPEAPTGDDTEV
jgi:arylsulfatase A-like enzyme